MTDRDEPAFPSTTHKRREDGHFVPETGMSLRDYFAAHAMVGITQALSQGILPHDVPKLAADCYFIADAMLKVRKQ